MESTKKQFLERNQIIDEVDNIVKEYIADNSIQCNIAAGTAIDIRDNVIKKLPVTEALEVPSSGIGDVSDGWHTFNELYHHRAILFSVICNMFPDRAWKSKKHHEGDMFEGMFIVGVDTPEGQATYHYDLNPYWDMFKVKELDIAPMWDGHSAKDAINRISSLSGVGTIDAIVKQGKWKYYHKENTLMCAECLYEHYHGTFHQYATNYCPNCGAKMYK